MFDLSWTELAVIIVIAVLVIKPEDLPEILKGASNIIKKIKNAGVEVRNFFDESLKEAGLKEEENNIRGHIKDLEGNLRETYDITDIKPLLKETAGKNEQS